MKYVDIDWRQETDKVAYLVSAYSLPNNYIMTQAGMPVLQDYNTVKLIR